MSSSYIKSFGVNAQRRLVRCKSERHDTRDLTFAPGWLVPFYSKDVIPSDVWNMKEVNAEVKQVLESYKPTFGDVYLSMYFFFVPYRILWKKWPEIFGTGKPSEWDDPHEVTAPLIKYTAGTTSTNDSTKSTSGNGYDSVVNTCVLDGTSNPPAVASKKYNLADYLGFALTEFDHSSLVEHDINFLMLAAYEKIWTDSFRDENVQEPDPDVEKCFNYSGSGALDVRFALHYANKLKDVYTQCLPSPQKGDPVTISLGESAPIMMEATSAVIDKDSSVALLAEKTIGFESSELPSVSPTFVYQSGIVPGYGQIYADLSAARSATVSDLRFDIALQNMRERDARGGTRYNEVLLSTFEAYNGDLAMQRPEFLGGDTVRLNMTTVPSTGDNPGKLGGMSNTNFGSRPFVKTFGEFGVLMGVMCVRPRNMYCQGMPKSALKYRRYHWFDPALQFVGDQPVYTKEIYALADPDDVLGFQEAWYEYDSDENVVCADMRGGTTDMDAWSYVQKFTSQPYLNAAFKQQDGKAITKTLVGYSDSAPGYVYSAHIDLRPEVTSPMVPNRIPGLMDHVI